MGVSTESFRLLVVGGYGGFGSRLVRRLLPLRELTILIAGRSQEKAAAFAQSCGDNYRLRPIALDRDDDVRALLDHLEPELVVDASGPFQAYGDDPYRFARMVLDSGACYLDLADSRQFVTGITALDEVARENRSFALSGVSTCPALSLAVARKLCAGLSEIHSIRGGIAPSPKSGLGRNVVDAIAGYAGRPVRLHVDGNWQSEFALIDTRNFKIAPPGHEALPEKCFALVDVPDLELFAEAGPNVANTWFGVATAPEAYQFVLRQLSRLVAAGRLKSLQPIAGLMHFVANRLTFGPHRGGMFIEVEGVDSADNPLQRTWHLVAEGDVGPFIPVLAAERVIHQCVGGDRLAAGARPAHLELELSDFEPAFSELGIVTGVRELLT